MSNSSSVNEFLLLAFAERRELQLLHFSLFLTIYLVALLANDLIITAVACDHHLHNPMYFFLLNLSLLDLGSTVLTSMANSLCGRSGKAMVSTRQRASARKTVATQTEPPQKHAAVQVSGCGECLSLSTLPGSGKSTACLRCEQVDDLLNLVAELKEEHSCAPKELMSNSSSFNEFLLLAFTDRRELQLLHFSLFLRIYLAALLANGLIITAVAYNHYLHTPMYVFLLVLSLLDLGNISTRSMSNSLRNNRTISYSRCAAQMFLLAILFSAKFSLLIVMVYDHFVAICRPLYFGTLLGSRACVKMAATAWIFRAVLRIPSEQGQHKAFFICLPHLVVVSFFVSNILVAFLKPPSISSPILDLVVAVLYSLVPPTLNTLIYSLRNEELKNALRKLVQQV
ncbi:PREDICTED: olfactory receptor 14J1-like [Tinamus guttatus]|uniref:olfactory receptor 14J1-like n=1 Tax=Tinamus guttatus TaxID=94827 RepID=UPI00052E88D5|nr:PREDICTED: olfactory receptor 14J1-like [Tinamus guttatus]